MARSKVLGRNLEGTWKKLGKNLEGNSKETFKNKFLVFAIQADHNELSSS